MTARRHRRLHRLERAGPASAARQGVGDDQLFGSQYAMRIWLDPAKLNNFDADAGRRRRPPFQAQNAQVAGRPARRPAVGARASSSTPRSRPSSACRRRSSSATSCCKVNTDGSQVRLRDVARVELGARELSRSHRLQRPAGGRPRRSSSRPGANALATAKAVRATLDELAPVLPAGPEGRSTPTTPRRSCASRSRRWSRRCSRRSCWCSW